MLGQSDRRDFSAKPQLHRACGGQRMWGTTHCSPTMSAASRAFVSSPLLLPRSGIRAPLILSGFARCIHARRSMRPLAMVSGGPEPSEAKVSTGVEEEDEYPAYSAIELDAEAMKEQALRAVEDVGTRPGFYGKIFAYAVGGVVSITVLKAIVAAIDSLPVLPGVLELIGLGYCAWFGWRYVIFKSSREELLEEIDDLLGRTTGRGE